MQQPADFIRGFQALTNLGFAGITLGQQMLQRMFEQTGQLGQGLETHGTGTAGQRMRQRNRLLGNLLFGLLHPLLQHAIDPGRPFIGFIQIDVVQRRADAQAIDILVAIVFDERGSVCLLQRRRRLCSLGMRQLRHVQLRQLCFGLGNSGRLRGDRDLLAFAYGRFKGGEIQLLHGIGRNGRLSHRRGRLHRWNFIRKLQRHCGQRFLLGHQFQLGRPVRHICCLSYIRHEFRKFQRGNFGSPLQLWQAIGSRFFADHGLRGLDLRIDGRRQALHRFERLCKLLTCAPARHQRHFGAFAMHAHGVRSGPERRGRPVLGSMLLQILRPGPKGLESIPSELLHGLGHGFLLGQPGVEHLLQCPTGFAELVQPHHARAALERMECPAQRGLLAQVRRLVGQRLQGLQTVVHHFACFLQEDGKQLVIAIQILRAQLHRLLYESGFNLHLLGREVQHELQALAFLCRALAGLHVGKDLGHGIRQGIGAFARMGRRGRWFNVRQRCRFGFGPVTGLLPRQVRQLGRQLQHRGLKFRLRNCSLHRSCRLRFKLRRNAFLISVCSYGRYSIHLRSSLNRFWSRLRRHGRYRSRHRCRCAGQIHRDIDRSSQCRASATALAHDDTQLVPVLVIHKQLARHIALIAEHVDQKAHRAKTAAQLFKDLESVFLRHLAQHQMLDGVAHALHGSRCLIETQHHEHTAHLRHLARHGCQHRTVQRIAEVLVQVFFRLAQRHAQLTNHGAHGLLVAGLAVQVFHPGFERLGGCAMQGCIQTLHQHA